MKEFIQLPRTLAVVGVIIQTLIFICVIAIYLLADQAIIQDFLSARTDDVTEATTALKEVLLPFGVIIFIPLLLNLLGILYMKRYIIASAVMLILSGLMMLYTVILPILLVTAGTMLITRYRYYNRNEKYQTPY
ncbi:DUF4064 domain-containing protein [Macrococcus brunensis]|uniref:DUF4064 domain-containing protein n=1 Tax=Macrococcus brunensis TaxID=198483 RepID=A0A4R6BF78_9STAP|nr:DUF4064 domain-containing protein [Macrococcus brunensis]TDL98474.1 DUF4064 domain-containing protein [Macrococcus brunensis]ULG72141.1 DUF4064 domain-containing protein [Macrococcus brunensis]ULG74393.1 DUF4064 domain-containing protein [Macrococcus brunensis]